MYISVYLLYVNNTLNSDIYGKKRHVQWARVTKTSIEPSKDGDVPFFALETKTLDCHHGTDKQAGAKRKRSGTNR